jgi:hypothetical protein
LGQVDPTRESALEIIIECEELDLLDLAVVSAICNRMLQTVAAETVPVQILQTAIAGAIHAPLSEPYWAAGALAGTSVAPNSFPFVITGLSIGSPARIKGKFKTVVISAAFVMKLTWSIEVLAPPLNIDVHLGGETTQSRPADFKPADIGPGLILLADTAIRKNKDVRVTIRDPNTGQEIMFEAFGKKK